MVSRLASGVGSTGNGGGSSCALMPDAQPINSPTSNAAATRDGQRRLRVLLQLEERRRQAGMRGIVVGVTLQGFVEYRERRLELLRAHQRRAQLHAGAVVRAVQRQRPAIIINRFRRLLFEQKVARR